MPAPGADVLAVSTRSAAAVAVAKRERRLLSGVGSGVALLTLTALFHTPTVGRRTCTATVTDAPLFRLGQLQVKVAAGAPQLPPPEGVADSTVAPASMVSLSTTAVAALGPLLVTVTL